MGITRHAVLPKKRAQYSFTGNCEAGYDTFEVVQLSLDSLKDNVRAIGQLYSDRERRARRIFIEERAAALQADRAREFDIRAEVSQYFKIPHSSVAFAGSAQIGFSVYKDTMFEPGVSDLDVACINSDLFQEAWIDIVTTTAGFSDLTKFSDGPAAIEIFKNQLLTRGMININKMPNSNLTARWRHFQQRVSRKHTQLFASISVAIYMNEYAFCWKQDSALSSLIR